PPRPATASTRRWWARSRSRRKSRASRTEVYPRRGGGMTQSRRDLLSLAVAAVAAEAAAAADAAAPAPPDAPNRPYVARYELIVAPRGGGCRARLVTTGGRTFEVELLDAEIVDPFVKMMELALAGKGKLALEVENDNKTVRHIRFEAP